MCMLYKTEYAVSLRNLIVAFFTSAGPYLIGENRTDKIYADHELAKALVKCVTT